MKKIIILFITFLLIFQNNLFSQDTRANLLKYWYYRDRLKYFVVPGPNQGESEIVCGRNRNDQGVPVDNISFGQHGINFGYYIGTLATEYRLLMNNGQIFDAQTTLNEVYLALFQFNRYLDRTTNYGDNDLLNEENGFFVRENVPENFLDVNTLVGKYNFDYLNQDTSDALTSIKNAKRSDSIEFCDVL
jgi:hypothetical protein